MQLTNPPVLIIHNTYLYTGGEETVVAAEIESLKANGYTVYYKEYTNANFKFYNFKTLLAPFNTIFNIFSFLIFSKSGKSFGSAYKSIMLVI